MLYFIAPLTGFQWKVGYPPFDVVAEEKIFEPLNPTGVSSYE